MIGKRDALATALRLSGGSAVFRALPVWSGVLVVNYHRIGEQAASPLDRDLFSATQEGFAAQMRSLARSCDVISPSDLDVLPRSRRGRYALVTFDDGYRDNYDLAFPVLRDVDVPATFFIATGFLDQPRLPWWDRIAWMVRNSPKRALPAGEWFDTDISLPPDRTNTIRIVLQRYKSLPAERTDAFIDYLEEQLAIVPSADLAEGLWMTWDMVREIAQSGMTIGAHTVQHHLLARLDPSRQRQEIIGSRDRVAEETGVVPTAFAYPIGKPGSFTETTKHLLAEAGFRHAFAFAGGYQSLDGYDRLAIRRTHVGHQLSIDAFNGLCAIPFLFARS